MAVKTIEKILTFLLAVAIWGGYYDIAKRLLDKETATQYVIDTVEQYDIDDAALRLYKKYAVENAKRLAEDPEAELVPEPDLKDDYEDEVVEKYKEWLDKVQEFINAAPAHKP